MLTTTLNANISDQDNPDIALSLSKAQARVLEDALSNLNAANLCRSEYEEWGKLIQHISQINVLAKKAVVRK